MEATGRESIYALLSTSSIPSGANPAVQIAENIKSMEKTKPKAEKIDTQAVVVPEIRGTDANGEEKVSKKQLKKQAKHGDKEKKEKPQWNLDAKKDKKPKKVQLNEEDEFINLTPPGAKKDISGPLAEKYNPVAVESAWDMWWEKQGYYHCTAEEVKDLPDDKKFIMVIPPPNVTGTLHIGHALMVSIEDVLCRYHRMKGKKVLWVPGTDHAGIATQSAVEAKLWKEEKKTRHDYGREEFLKKVWEFKEEKGNIILEQIRCLGASVDHSRTTFTMDEVRYKAVVEAFVRMYDMGLIYRKTRLVNWSSALNTAISDIEVDSKELECRTLISIKTHGNKKYEFGVLTEFMYEVAGSSTNEKVTVATTRLETMLGDTAVAVHPADPRYSHLHGKFVRHPFFNRLLPIVTDAELVDMSFGTGVVKITPAHDENDYKCGERNGLPMLNMLSDDGKIDISQLKANDEPCFGEKYHGMWRYDARKEIEKDLKAMGLLGEKKDNKMVLPICSRSGDVIEPRLKDQWWVESKEMARRSVEAVEKGELELIPSFHKDTWYRFLNDPHEWCISRQLWWGHRIPAYHISSLSSDPDINEALMAKVKAAGIEWVVQRNEDLAKQKALQLLLGKGIKVSIGDITLKQDDDVLDTWFSSGIFPFSVFGWPDPSEDLKAFFPGTLLETGHDILFFWVARMVMMSLTLENVLPFKTVYLHAIVRDRYGRKMSKSLGNIIDPLAVVRGCSLEALNDTIRKSNLADTEIEKAIKGQNADYPEGIPQCGADALRFGLLANISQGRDVNLDINSVFATRKFCNKIWQVTRFCIILCGETLQRIPNFLQSLEDVQLEYRDKWILNELKKLVKLANENMNSYSFGEFTNNVMTFWVAKLCDVYVESIKPLVRNAEDSNASDVDRQKLEVARNVLFSCLDIGLKVLHPVMPFVTEELWQNLPGNKIHLLNGKSDSISIKDSIMISKYPEVEDFFLQDFSEAVEIFELADKISHAMRSLKADYNITKKDAKFMVFCDDARLQKLCPLTGDIENLGNGIATMESEAQLDKYGKGFIPLVVDGHLQVMMEMKGNVDIEGRIKKLEKDLDGNARSLDGLVKKLENEKFLESASEPVLLETKEKKINLEDVIEKLAKQIQDLKAMI